MHVIAGVPVSSREHKVYPVQGATPLHLSDDERNADGFSIGARNLGFPLSCI